MPATHPAYTIHEDGMWLPQWLVLKKKKKRKQKQNKKTNKQKKGYIRKNLPQNGEPQRYNWEREEEEPAPSS